MANLKDHQQAMVDLMASGSGIPASAMRLAHAMHDVLAYLNLEEAIHHAPLYGADATTLGLNDKALAADVEACRKHPWQKPDVTIRMDLYERARAAERRVKELENTVNQLRARVAKLKADQAYWYGRCLDAGIIDGSQEQAGCRKDDTQEPGLSTTKGFLVPPGARFVCEHEWVENFELGRPTWIMCEKCGAHK